MMFLDPRMDLSVGLNLLVQVADVVHDSRTLHLFIFLDPSGSILNTGNLDGLVRRCADVKNDEFLVKLKINVDRETARYTSAMRVSTGMRLSSTFS